MDSMVSAIIHLANKDYSSLVDDFIALKILPDDCDRAKVALSPYVKGGGAKQYEEELKKMYGFDDRGAVGGFQAMTTDMLTVLNDIPFSIPAYFALLARAVVTLEGLALTADPSYGLVVEAYPFVARKLLSSSTPQMQQALQQVLYSSDTTTLTPSRLASLLNSAAGMVGKKDGQVFVDLDAVPEEGLSPSQTFRLLLSSQASSLRPLLTSEASLAADLSLLLPILNSSLSSLPYGLPPLDEFTPHPPLQPDPLNAHSPLLYLPNSHPYTELVVLSSLGRLLSMRLRLCSLGRRKCMPLPCPISPEPPWAMTPLTSQEET
ncbi:MAG: hypothetical protein SGPRY_001944 [Prymnesium sp.]